MTKVTTVEDLMTAPVLRDAAKWARTIGAVTDGSDYFTVTDEDRVYPIAARDIFDMEPHQRSKVCGMCIAGAVLYAAVVDHDAEDVGHAYTYIFSTLGKYARAELEERRTPENSSEIIDIFDGENEFTSAIDMFGTDYVVDVLERAADDMETAAV